VPSAPEPNDEVAQERARRLLFREPSLRGLADASFERLQGGHANHAWLARDSGGSWYVRLNSEDGARLGVDRRGECALLAVVSEAGLQPAVRYCNPEKGMLVTRYVEGEPWSRAAARETRNLRRLASLLRCLHALPVVPGAADVSFRRQAQNLEAQAPAGSVPQQIRASAATVFQRLSRRRNRAPCHNDPHHLNIIDDGERIWLVDWEYGGNGDFLFDLAAFLCHLEADGQDCSMFTAFYGLDAGTDGRDLQDACWAFDYVRWLWYLARGRNADWAAANDHGALIDSLRHRLLATMPTG